MQKIILVLFATLISANVFALGLTKEEMTVQNVFEFPGKSQKQIFDLTQQWLSERFATEQGQFSYKNEREGTMAGNFKSKVNFFLGVFEYHISLKVETKAGKARFTFVPLGIASCNNFRCGTETDYFDSVQFNSVKKHIKYYCDEYEKYMKTPVKTDKNW